MRGKRSDSGKEKRTQGKALFEDSRTPEKDLLEERVHLKKAAKRHGMVYQKYMRITNSTKKGGLLLAHGKRGMHSTEPKKMGIR